LDKFLAVLTVLPALMAAPAPQSIALPTADGARYGRISYSDTAPLADHEIALTFDDGPDDQNTARVLAVLARHGVNATFFLTGQEVDADPDTVRKIAQAGHTIGAHSYTHPPSLSDMPLAHGISEIDRSIAAIGRALAQLAPAQRNLQVRFFRFPEHKEGPALLVHLQAVGQASVAADYGVDDWLDISGAEILQRALERTEERRGGVMLLHDWSPGTVSILDELMTTLEQRGYLFVQLVELRAGPAAGATPSEKR
jgi:peptidoglycan/xylan/chitin deacetylase (PgdA/CDA1 family)